MGVGNAFSTLSRFLDRLERDEMNVVTARPHDADVVTEGEMVVDVELRVPLGGSVETDVEDGALTVAVSERRPLLPPDLAGDGVTIESRNARFDADGYVDVELSVRVATDPTAGREESASTPDRTEDATTPDDGDRSPSDGDRGPERDEGVPPYEDTAYLEALYRSCDTFTEVAEEFEIDVTAETVRRYMIDAGVHDPTTYDTGDATTVEEADAETEVSPDADDRDVEVLVTDGVGLPDGMSVDEFIGVVRRSNTLYDFTRETGLDREEARTFLDERNLLDLVVGRLTEKDERVSREMAVERMRQSVS